METVELAFDLHEYEETRPELNPVVMLPGITWSKFLYRDLARDLCQATRRKVFVLDLRNHGESPSTDDFTIEMMKEDVKRFMAEQQLKKVVFVCHSFSNSIAYVIAIEQPEVVEKLIMIDNPPFNDYTEQFKEENVYPMFYILNGFLEKLDNRVSLKDARAKFYNLAKGAGRGQGQLFRKVAYDLTKENGKFRWKKDVHFLNDQFQKGKFTFTPRGYSDKEILIIRCADSGCVPDSKFEAVLRHNPNAKLTTFENTTHILMFEEQEKFIKTAKDFLQTSDS